MNTPELSSAKDARQSRRRVKLSNSSRVYQSSPIPSMGLDNVRAQFHEAAEASHLPAVETAATQRLKSWLDRQRCFHDHECSPAGKGNCGE